MKAKIKPVDAYKGFTLDQDKIISPKETVRRFMEKTSRLKLDILKETKRIDNNRIGIPVYFSVCGSDASKVTNTAKQMGKGATSQQAEASAVMELAERFSFFSFCRNDDKFITKKYKDVGDKAFPFEMIAKSVHDESEDLDAAQKVFQELPLKWTWGTNLTKDEEVMIPFSWFYAINEFNGPSAGNCVEEALNQGISEIVERHVSALVSRKKLRVPGINPDSATDSMVREMFGKYEKCGIKIHVSDFSLDTGIPTIGVLGWDPSTFPHMSEIVWTAGTTPDPQKALSRALTEVAQLAGDFNTSSNYVASGLPKFREIEQADFITNPLELVDISTLPDLSSDNIRIEIENCIAALAKKQMEVLAIDTMHEGLEIPAFYTIIPGAYFRERARGTSVGMFSSKLIFENNEPETAMKELEKADALLCGKYYVKFYKGSCAVSMGKSGLALDYFKEALDLGPGKEERATIYSHMGSSLKDLGEYDKALEALNKGEALDKERTDIYNLKGFCYFKKKDHEMAIESFKKVLALDPSSAIDYANIGSNYRDMGNLKKAADYYRMALNIDPSIDFALENLKKIEE